MLKELIKDVIISYNKKVKNHYLVFDSVRHSNNITFCVIKDDEIVRHVDLLKETTVLELEEILEEISANFSR